MKYVDENAIKKLISLIKGDLAKKQDSITVSGLLKGNGTTISAAIAETDYMVPPNGGTIGQILKKTETGTEWADESGAADAVQSNLDTHVNNNDIHVTSEEKSAWNESILIANDIIQLPTSSYWCSIAYGNGIFVAVNKANTYAYSYDGLIWNESTLPISHGYAVCYANGIFVVTGYGNSIAYSVDGFNWSVSTAPSNTKGWNSIAYGNGAFVAVSKPNSNMALYSTDGMTWQQTTMPSSKSWSSVTYGNGKFVAVAEGNSSVAAYSTDGITWIQTNMPTSAYWMSVTYGNGKFVAVTYGSDGSTVSAYSEDGITWTQATLPILQSWHSVTYGNGKFVAVGTISAGSNYVAYSSDGINWAEASLPVSSTWQAVTYDNGMFVVISGGGTCDIVYSTDGITWSNIKSSLQTVSGTDVTDDTKVILGIDKPITPESIGAATMTEVNAAIQTAIGNAIGGSY